MFGLWVTETVAAQVAVLLPSIVTTVIVAEPAATAVTSPEWFTVITFEALLDQVTSLLVASVGLIVAESCCVPPTVKAIDVGLNETEATDTSFVQVEKINAKIIRERGKSKVLEIFEYIVCLFLGLYLV